MASDESERGIKIISRGEPAKLSGGVVIEGFPESGFAGTIASSCLVASLKLALVAEMSSDHFPPLATVMDGRLQAPARIYADTSNNIAIFLGDFVLGQRASNAMAKTIVGWAKEKGCAFVLSLFSTPLQEGTEEHEVSAVVNNQGAEEIVGRASIPLAKLTAVGGVSGRLLLEGREAGVPVVTLLVKTHKGIEDFEAGIKLAEAIMKLVPNARCELAGMKEEAKRTEGTLRRIRNQTAPPGVYG